MHSRTTALLKSLKILLPVMALAITAVAFAQAAVTSPPPQPTSTMWQHIFMLVIQGALALIFSTLIPIFVVKLLPKLPALTQHFVDWAQHQAGGVKNSYEQGVLQRAIALAGQKVLALENTEVAYVQSQLASGAITKDQLPALMAGIKQRAIDAVKADATAQGIWDILVKIFLGNSTSLTNWLGDVIESHVAQLPSTSTTPKVAPSNPVASTTSALKTAPATPQAAAPR